MNASSKHVYDSDKAVNVNENEFGLKRIFKQFTAPEERSEDSSYLRLSGHASSRTWQSSYVSVDGTGTISDSSSGYLSVDENQDSEYDDSCNSGNYCFSCLLDGIETLATHICHTCRPERKFICHKCLQQHNRFCDGHEVISLSAKCEQQTEPYINSSDNKNMKQNARQDFTFNSNNQNFHETFTMNHNNGYQQQTNLFKLSDQEWHDYHQSMLEYSLDKLKKKKEKQLRLHEEFAREEERKVLKENISRTNDTDVLSVFQNHSELQRLEDERNDSLQTNFLTKLTKLLILLCAEIKRKLGEAQNYQKMFLYIPIFQSKDETKEIQSDPESFKTKRAFTRFIQQLPPEDVARIFQKLESKDLSECSEILVALKSGDEIKVLQSVSERCKSKPSYRLSVVTAEVFEEALRQCQIYEYDHTYSNYFPRDCRMFIGIPVYKGCFINRRVNKDRGIGP